ncbi:hypothetical protein SISSUDRAFT_223680 [Sistotremastrum suecicum HHB10207 ss-3]|uniref:Uncharacterized protein n=1 Tax=Sistotremastrum suecicum HHB10207 ss-3 TaxID=1314776 RepID=A0A166A4U0_9AGAM|nr:hypothetical protein SISSUDRAFT_223680 [Sistotremastrum suecicum HHB10207 ss-3]
MSIDRTAAPPAHPIFTKFNVTSTDLVASTQRINVALEDTGRVVWYKERHLTEEEIVECVYATQPTLVLRWTIHRPLRGWYIRLRTPSFPPGSFVSINPSSSSLSVEEGSLEFGCRTNVWSPTWAEGSTHSPRVSLVPLSPAAKARASEEHSYPPTPSPTSLSRSPPPAFSSLYPPQSQITKFVLKPTPHAAPSSDSYAKTLLNRAVTTFKHTLSFSLSPLLASDSPESVDPGHALPIHRSHHANSTHPLLTFVETSTSTLVWSAQSGVLQVDEGMAAQLGVDMSFWVAVSLAYWEYLGEREGYIAAANG